MMQHAIVILVIVLFSGSCASELKRETKNKMIEVNSRYFKSTPLFDDSSYIFTLRTIDTTYSYSAGQPTAIVTLLYLNRDKIDTLVIDSLFVRNHPGEYPELNIEYEDLNFDGTNDILLAAGSDPRPNKRYHLYLVDRAQKKLSYVERFLKIGNPEPDGTNRLIKSYIFSGQIYWQFFYIDQNSTLHQVGPTFISEPDTYDSLGYQNALNAAIKDQQKFF